MIKTLEQYGSTSASATAQAKALAEKKRLQAIADAKAVASAKARVLSQQKAYADAQAKTKADAQAKANADAQAKAKADAQAVNDAKARVLSQQSAYANAQKLVEQAKVTGEAKPIIPVVEQTATKPVARPVAKPVSQPQQASTSTVQQSASTSVQPIEDGATSALTASKDEQIKAQDLAWQEALRLANEQKTGVTSQAEALAQEAYVSKMQQQRVLPNIMAQSGLQGQGYTETTANNIGTSYQNALNSVNKNKMDALSKVDSSLMGEQSKIGQNKAGIDAQYQTNLANYRQSQAKALATASKSSGSGRSPSKTTTRTTTDNAFKNDDPKKNPAGAVKDALAGFAWNPRDPQGSRIAMKNYLQVFVTNKLMTETQLEKYIAEFMAGYYDRANPGGSFNMNENQRRAS